MSAPTVIRQGGSLPFVFDRDGEDITDFVCEISVKRFPDDVSLIPPRIIPPVNDEWPGFLSQTETAPLAVGIHFIIAKLTNSITDEERQIPERFTVSKAWV